MIGLTLQKDISSPLTMEEKEIIANSVANYVLTNWDEVATINEEGCESISVVLNL